MGGRYRPYAAERKAAQRSSATQAAQARADPGLWDHVAAELRRRWSPEQIARRLPRVFPEQPERRLCHETIYQSFILQPRGELRRLIAAALRSGRAYRRARAEPGSRIPREQGEGRFKDPMVMISERPAEADDRAVPGHWEGDLIIGETTARRSPPWSSAPPATCCCVPCPRAATPPTSATSSSPPSATLPAHLRRSLTWDQGAEMAGHRQFTLATDMPVYFCDPASPWMRGSNENTNGLLRQYFPKGTDLSVHTPTTSPPSPPNSTDDPARHSTGTPQPSALLACLNQAS